MKVKVAETAGFCFGVKRAVNKVYELIDTEQKPIFTLGPIIHNEGVVADLEARGVHVIAEADLDSPDDTLQNGTVVIRSHGVGKPIYDKLKEKNISYVDVTCPFVLKIHRIVEKESLAGNHIIIIGDKDHPEVQGICGWCQGPYTVIRNKEEAEAFVPPKGKKISIVSQTTFNYNKFKDLVEILCKKRYDNNVLNILNILNTICNATEERQREAKKQIWGVGENMGTEESKKIWEENAQFWDNAMGDESNEFHREVVRPKVTELLSPNPADYILDIACGNGNYSSYLAQRGASVVAFDYSKKMIELAKRRQSQYAKQIEFCVADATDRKSILELKRNRAFTKAVSNMAIMDITDIEPLLMAVYELLQESGIFVFATQHPCFVTLTEKYMTPHSYYDIAIEGQPKEQIYYHRSIQDIFNLCFRAGFVIDGFYEECFKTNKEIPMVMIVRLKKVKRDSLK